MRRHSWSPDFRALARNSGGEVFRHLDAMRDARNERDRDFWERLASQCARSAASHALRALKETARLNHERF